ncbi:hypothetical protein QBC42DRAFT_112746 [Cladorrhinum samala]|uniref:RNase H type-1 domain-containing protein n=1 Tax=Cladorrhinum samala TaxID=585594 RepID=A0AAV9HH82_9PEZI|nr:hypothetical protein QBC42DRAFT_112746 [Cladorrhinum samala]
MSNPGILILPGNHDDPAVRQRHILGRQPGLGRRRRGNVQPATRFRPQDPTLTPEAHFPLQNVGAIDRRFPRFINRFDSREMLLVIDGSWLNNGSKEIEPAAGSSFKFKDPPCGSSASTIAFPFSSEPGLPMQGDVGGVVAFPMEERGPKGDVVDHTSNRAKLRAVIAALQFRPWAEEGWHRVVILTDLEYIVHGATALLPTWVDRGWKKRRRGRNAGSRQYANRDLWEELQHCIDELREQRCQVSFWLVNGRDARQSRYIANTKDAAKRAAKQREDDSMLREEFTRLCGIMM